MAEPSMAKCSRVVQGRALRRQLSGDHVRSRQVRMVWPGSRCKHRGRLAGTVGLPLAIPFEQAQVRTEILAMDLRVKECRIV